MPYIERVGTRAGPVARRLLRGRKTRHCARTLYSLKSVLKLKKVAIQDMDYRDYFQAGKSVAGITTIQPAAAIVTEFAAALNPGQVRI